MPATSSAGPYRQLQMDDGRSAPFYLLVFDKEGQCQSPLSLARLLDEVNAGVYSHAHVFSHGWNNVFEDAVELYQGFFDQYFALRKTHAPSKAEYRPVMVGIIWPSTLLVLPWEATPKIAGGPDAEAERKKAADDQALRDAAELLPAEKANRLSALVEPGSSLKPEEARELAEILLPVYQSAAAGAQETDDGKPAAELTADDLLRLWMNAAPPREGRSGKPGFAKDEREAPTAAAFDWSMLDPRWPVRLASVLQMKDRAGRVGSNGVGPGLVQPLLSSGNVETHLVGHSYGSKVVLSALCCRTPARPAASLLLLEPAVSYLCFGEDIDGQGRDGGYRSALASVRQPVLSTFSSADAPLSKFFHRAAIRDADWGEKRIAGMPPNRFAALGGYGPGGLKAGESKTIDVISPDGAAPGNRYPRGEAGIRIYGLDGSKGQITGHGDVATKYTAWAHLNLVAEGAF